MAKKWRFELFLKRFEHNFVHILSIIVHFGFWKTPPLYGGESRGEFWTVRGGVGGRLPPVWEGPLYIPTLVLGPPPG